MPYLEYSHLIIRKGSPLLTITTFLIFGAYFYISSVILDVFIPVYIYEMTQLVVSILLI